MTRELLSDRLLREAGEAWARALQMRFVEEATSGVLSDRVFARYLVLERQFVEVACRSLGAAILRAPSSRAIQGHARTLSSFLGEQTAYFEEATGRLRDEPCVGVRAQNQADDFSRRVLEICDAGSYAEIVSCMLPSECLYAAWCFDAASRDVQRPTLLNEWIHAHARPPYTDTVAFLRSEVDALGVDESDVRRLGRLVAEILELEVSFHEAAYVPD